MYNAVRIRVYVACKSLGYCSNIAMSCSINGIELCAQGASYSNKRIELICDVNQSILTSKWMNLHDRSIDTDPGVIDEQNSLMVPLARHAATHTQYARCQNSSVTREAITSYAYTSYHSILQSSTRISCHKRSLLE